MRTISTIIFVLSIILLSGCQMAQSNTLEITEEEAKQMVQEKHYSEHGDVEITSVCDKPDKFVINWKIAPIEAGKDSVFKETGEIKLIGSSRGSCQWK